VIFAEMPSWVKAPYDSPFVTAFPDPDIEVVPSSFVVTAKTTITTDHTISNGEAKAYGTSETRGTSDARSDTVTWNQWQEVSVTTPGLQSVSQTRGYVKPPPIPLSSLCSGHWALKVGCFIAEAFIGQAITEYGPVLVKESGKAIYNTSKSLIESLMSEPMSGTPDDFNLNNLQINKGLNQCVQPQGTRSPQSTLSELSCRPKSPILPVSGQQLAQDRALAVGIQDRNPGNQRIDYYSDGASSVGVRPVYDTSYPSLTLPVPSTTVTGGSSRGGALTTTHTEYEEHTISQSQQFSSSQS
jgi:hypothetical protein